MTSDDLTIRPMQDGEQEALAALWQDCDLLRPWNDPNHDIAHCRSNPSGELFVGLSGGDIVASVMAGNDGHRGVVYYVATSPVHRGKGFGRQMIGHAENWLKSRGVWKINLMIREDNDAVRNFYQTLGYETEPRTVMSRRIAEQEADSTLTTIITSLEMKHRPAASCPPPPIKNLALLRLERPTAAFYRYLYSGVGAPWLWYERSIISDEKLLPLIEHEKVEIYVLYVHGTPAGYFELNLKEFPDIELAYFGLMPEFIGMKLGPYLLGQAIDTAWAHNPERLWVHTCDLDHPGALPLYRRLGFEPFARQSDTFEDPRLGHPQLNWPSPPTREN